MRRISSVIAAVLAALLMAACPGDKPDPNAPPLTAEQKIEKQKQDAQAVLAGYATGQEVGARVMQTGIPTVKQFRLSGQLDPKVSKKAAKIAQKIDRAMLKVTDFLVRLDAVGPSEWRTLYDDLQLIYDLAQEIQSVRYTVNPGAPKSAQTKAMVFDLSMIGAGIGLQVAADKLKSVPSSFNLQIPAEVKSQLERTRPVLVANLEALDASLKELEGVSALPRRAKQRARVSAPTARSTRA